VPCLRAQVTVSGTVYDVTKKNLVENVRVVSTGGLFAITDSMGRYNVMVNTNDSIFFSYNNKPTQKFPVKQITSPTQFDISIRVPVQSKYRVLEEVKVFSRTYQQDSIENRQTYADVFEYEKPGIKSSINPSGMVGADLNELINIFRFRSNKQIRAFQQRLVFQEEEKYVNYRFSKNFVARLTGLTAPSIDSFMRWYRPTYEFTKLSDEITFTQYVLDASIRYKKLLSLSPAKKEDAVSY